MCPGCGLPGKSRGTHVISMEIFHDGESFTLLQHSTRLRTSAARTRERVAISRSRGRLRNIVVIRKAEASAAHMALVGARMSLMTSAKTSTYIAALRMSTRTTVGYGPTARARAVPTPICDVELGPDTPRTRVS